MKKKSNVLSIDKFTVSKLTNKNLMNIKGGGEIEEPGETVKPDSSAICDLLTVIE